MSRTLLLRQIAAQRSRAARILSSLARIPATKTTGRTLPPSRPFSKRATQQKRVLVTGASGTIGQALVSRLLETPEVNIIKATSRRPAKRQPEARVTEIQTDFCNTEIHRSEYWRTLIRQEQVTHIVNLAGGTSPPRAHQGEAIPLEWLNLDPVRAIAIACEEEGETEFLQVSSMAAAEPLAHETPYSRTKRDAEIETRMHNKNAIIVRPGLVVCTRRIRHAFSTDQIAYGLPASIPVPIIGSGKQKIQLVSLNDTVEGLVRLVMDSENYRGRTFNFVGPDVVSQIGLLSLFRDFLGRDLYPMFVDTDSKLYQRLLDLAELVPFGTFNLSLLRLLAIADAYPSVAGFGNSEFRALLGRDELTSILDLLEHPEHAFEDLPMKEFATRVMHNGDAIRVATKLILPCTVASVRALIRGPKHFSLQGKEQSEPAYRPRKMKKQ